MKTIIVVYSNSEVNIEKTTLKRYPFITHDNFKVGDRIRSNAYNTDMVVVKLLKTSYKFYHGDSGKLTNTYNNTRLYKVRNLVLRTDADNTIYASRVEPNKCCKA